MSSQEDKGNPNEGNGGVSNPSKAEEIKDKTAQETSKRYEELIENLRRTDNKFKKQAIKSNKARKQLSVFREKISRIVVHPVNTDENTSKPKKTPTKDVAFARMDYKMVHREIMDIKSCRTNLFMGTIAVIGGVGIAILGIRGTLKESPWQNWLPLATMIPIGLLTSAIFATIHKARGINVRAGYMEALGEYLAKGKAPPKFCGWFRAKLVLDRCKIYLRINKEKLAKCEVYKLSEQKHKDKRKDTNKEVEESFNSTRKHKASKINGRTRIGQFVFRFFTSVFKRKRKEKQACSVEAKVKASEINKIVAVLPPFLHSFTSLSTYIFSLSYLLSIILLLWAILAATFSKNIQDFQLWLYLIGIVIGGVITGFAIRILAKKWWAARSNQNGKVEIKSVKTKQNVPWEDFFRSYSFFAGAFIAPLLSFALVCALAWGKSASWDAMKAYGFGSVVSAITVSIAYSCYDKVASLRRGRHSFERWRHIWKMCFEYCPLMEEPTQHELPNEIEENEETG